jgi:hypothetical protein
MNLCDASARIATVVSYLLVLCHEGVGEQEKERERKKVVNEFEKSTHVV